MFNIKQLSKFEKKANIRSKSTLSAIALILLLAISAILACQPTAFAQSKTATTAYLSLRPTTIGVNQELLINAWTTPTPPLDYNNPLAPGIPLHAGTPRTGYTFTFTKPDGTTETVTKTSTGEGAAWFVYVPNQVGTWSIQFTWAGDVNFAAASTEKLQFIVQADPVASWPAASPPTQAWSYPINPENREWADIAGGYWEVAAGNGRGYDSSASRFNPYTTAPRSAHILWTLDPVSGMAGLVGQPYGNTAFYSATSASIGTVMVGRAYYVGKGMIHCVNLTDGEELWAVPGSYTLGNIDVAGTTYTPVLLDISNNVVKYNALTGAVIFNITNAFTGPFSAFIGNQYIGFSNPYAYVWQQKGTSFYLVKIDTSGSDSALNSHITWNVSLPYRVASGVADIGTAINAAGDTIVIVQFDEYSDSMGVDLKTGNVLWHKPIDNIEAKPSHLTSGNGLVWYCVRNQMWVGMDFKTGEIKVTTEAADYPWGEFWSYGNGFAYNQLIGLSYAGVYAFDPTTGEINWHYSAGNSGMETPYNTWPFGSIGPVIADGVVFAPTSEHSPGLYYRGQQLHAIDAYTGDKIWSIMGYWTPTAIAQGKLFATNAYDGVSYCFGKGTTETTVSVSDKVLSRGSSLLIEGSVMDLSPAQPNTPAISDASMSAWMEYLHMQQPIPGDATGVAVTLTAVSSTGSSTVIGSTTSDMSGNYAYMWTPSDEGTYAIIASFAGSESYYASYAETAVGVTSSSGVAPDVSSEPSSSSAVSSTPSAGIDNPGSIPAETSLIVVAAVIVVIAVIAVAVVLRKQKNGSK